MLRRPGHPADRHRVPDRVGRLLISQPIRSTRRYIMSRVQLALRVPDLRA